MSSCFKMGFKGKYENESATNFMKNGEKLLEGMIASCGGKWNPIRSFSLEELQEATNGFHRDQIILREGDFYLYRGIVGGHPITIKRYLGVPSTEQEYSIADIVIGSQMSSHKNVLKLIGCCFETQCPMAVYEYAGNFTLQDYIFAARGYKGLQPLPWKCRIDVAMCIANAIAYLHTALFRPVVNRNLRPQIVLIDTNNVPKLLDFSDSVSIPEGETHIVVEKLGGTYGFLDPEWILTSKLSEKSDVYSFGVILLMLLTGRSARDLFNDDGFTSEDAEHEYVRRNRLKEMLDPSIAAEESSPGKEQEIQEFCTLALACIRRESEDRPTMIEVGKELSRMHRSTPSLLP